jgi:hypothetical protein
VLLNLEDETSVNNGLLLDTPKSVTQSAKEAKKAPVQISKDSSDDSSNKKGTKSESKAASSGNSNSQSTSVAQVDNTSTSSAPAEETQSAASTQPQEASATLASVSLDINKLQPEVNKSIIEAISTKVATVNATIASAIPTITLPTSTVNTGFTTDGTSAILYVNNSGVIFYKVKVDTNATFTVTDKDSTKEYPLNYGSKLKVNIIQR